MLGRVIKACVRANEASLNCMDVNFDPRPGFDAAHDLQGTIDMYEE